uniref:Interleukin-2 like n=1 Tax=Dicentrarchus labrax TaxID=13489 RepID=A0A3P8MXJ7_DICLA|nr:interleukin-2 like [Dicentrarchus labrax]
MEQSFRIALCMCLLIGYLQATPVPTPQSCFEMDDLRFHLLHGSCKNNVTLTTPTNVKETCYSAAMERFMEGLERAETECNGDNERFSQTLEALKVGNECYKHTNSSQCDLEAETQQFDEFVYATEAFVQLLNTKKRQ